MWVCRKVQVKFFLRKRNDKVDIKLQIDRKEKILSYKTSFEAFQSISMFMSRLI